LFYYIFLDATGTLPSTEDHRRLQAMVTRLELEKEAYTRELYLCPSTRASQIACVTGARVVMSYREHRRDVAHLLSSSPRRTIYSARCSWWRTRWH